MVLERREHTVVSRQAGMLVEGCGSLFFASVFSVKKEARSLFGSENGKEVVEV